MNYSMKYGVNVDVSLASPGELLLLCHNVGRLPDMESFAGTIGGVPVEDPNQDGDLIEVRWEFDSEQEARDLTSSLEGSGHKPVFIQPTSQ